MDWLDIVGAVYVAVAAIVCVTTWIECSRTFFVMGRPSGLLTGVTWPLWAAVGLVVLACMAARRVRASLPNHVKEMKR